MAELKKYLNERGLREVWDIINGQNSLIVSKIKDIQKRTTVGLYADSTSGWEENESKISEAGALYIYTDAETFNGKVIAKVKIGDGTSSLADLSFIDAPYSAHIADKDIHFTAEERTQWNNEISAFVTAAEESADTAMQAAERAETAKTAAETARDTTVSAKERALAAEANSSRFQYEAEKSAQNAKDSEKNAAKSAERAAGAEQGAISNANKAGDYATKSGESANNAGIAANRALDFVRDAGGQADRATVAANRSETAAQTAQTAADSTAADRQAVQTLATQVTADKATVADHAAQVAEDRTAAETAAQTAQAVADSLPEDYTTAVGKIAENTAEINNTNSNVNQLKSDIDNIASGSSPQDVFTDKTTLESTQIALGTGKKIKLSKNTRISSNFIPIEPNTEYAFGYNWIPLISAGVRQIDVVFYTSNEEDASGFIDASIENTQSFITPANAVYARFCASTQTSTSGVYVGLTSWTGITLQKGNTPVAPNFVFGPVSFNEMQIQKIEDLISESGTDVPQDVIDAAGFVNGHLERQTITDILINKGTHAGKVPIRSTLKDGADWYTNDEYFNSSDLNVVEPGKTYTIFTTDNNERLSIFYQAHYYDENKTWLSMSGNFTKFTAPLTQSMLSLLLVQRLTHLVLVEMRLLKTLEMCMLLAEHIRLRKYVPYSLSKVISLKTHAVKLAMRILHGW